MKIYYRVSPFLSSHPNPLGRDKKHIVYTCFKSFQEALGDQDVSIVADSMPTDWYELFRGYNIIKSPSGNVQSFHKQIDLVCKLPNEEKIMLVEDDYLWLPDSINKIEEALDSLELISPYDHPGHYTEERFQTPKLMKLINGHTYREAPSNTLTFATHAYLIKQNQILIKSYGTRDHEMFESLRTKMFVPVPSFSTHLVEGLLAPNINWDCKPLK